MQLETLTSKDSKKIIELYKNELDELGLLGSVYQSPKAANYIAFLCDTLSESFYGINQNNLLIAAIQLKPLATSLHINNMAVDSRFQGKGLGTLLMKKAVKLATLSNLYLSLDVDSTNHNAIGWYNYLGFQSINQKYTSVFKLSASKSINPILINEQSLHKFGFTEISIPSLQKIRLFFIQPNVYRMNSHVLLTQETHKYLDDNLNGLLLINTDLVPKKNLVNSHLQKISIRMLKDDI